MDDDWVTSITKSEVVTSAAYLLIYQRVHPIRMADPRDFISFNVARNEIKKRKGCKRGNKGFVRDATNTRLVRLFR